MMWHVVLFRPRSGITPEHRAELAEAFERARRDIPTIRRFHVGRRVPIGAGYEAAMPDELTHAAIAEFDDRDGLHAYLHHPSHDRLGALFGALADRALIYDFEMTEDVVEMRQLPTED